MRTRPKSFIPELEAMLPRFQGDIYLRPNGGRLRTKEGPKAVKELIDYLKTAKPVNPLEWNPDLRKAAKDHVMDHAKGGETGHQGSDGSSPFDRMKRYTTL